MFQPQPLDSPELLTSHLRKHRIQQPAWFFPMVCSPIQHLRCRIYARFYFTCLVCRSGDCSGDNSGLWAEVPNPIPRARPAKCHAPPRVPSPGSSRPRSPSSLFPFSLRVNNRQPYAPSSLQSASCWLAVPVRSFYLSHCYRPCLINPSIESGDVRYPCTRFPLYPSPSTCTEGFPPSCWHGTVQNPNRSR